MRTQIARTLFTRLAAGVGVGCLVSCSAAEDGPRSPVENAPERHRAAQVSSGAGISSSATPPPASSNSIKPKAGAQDVEALPCGARPMRYLGDLPPHFLSQNVPDRACGDDSECGDGFCDRGRCAPIWEDWYGQRCTQTCQCGSFLCLEGRCRSCLYHAECGKPKFVCSSYGVTTSKVSFGCGGVLGFRVTQMPPDPVRPPPTP